MRRRAGGFHARATLEEEQERPVAAIGRSDLAGEHRDLLSVRLGVAQRNRELVLGENQPGWTCDVRHGGDSAR